MKTYNKRFVRMILLWLSAAAFICAIYVLSGQEGAASHKLSKGVVREARAFIELPGFLKQYSMELGLSYEHILRKTAHFSLFFILALLLYLAIKYSIKSHAGLITIAGCILFAVMDEYHQVFITGRTARLTDILIDAAGAAFALLLIMVFTRYLEGKFKSKKEQQMAKFKGNADQS